MEYLNKRFLELFPAKEEHEIIKLETTTGGLVCLKTLRDNNIFCVPVVHADKPDRIAGLLSMVDIMAFTVKLFHTDPQEFGFLLENALRGSTALELYNYSKMNTCHPLKSETSTLKDIMHALSQSGVHRVPMVGAAKFYQELLLQKEKRPLERFLTQSDLLGFIADHIDHFGAIINSPIGNTLGSRPVITVLKTLTVVDAFKQLMATKVNSLGVVDESGVLVGNISARDVRYVLKHTPGAELLVKLEEFSKHIHANSSEVPKEVICCKETDTLKDIIAKLHSNHIHQIYVVDDEKKPLAVISLGDIFAYLLKNMK
eukprot:TRINITY_DN2308_c0_g1_i1.p1 TRINITY_DN2308_c0_g1~~TRINITY_DN2308_c0_g1_i1.p1  ORF type:complete len:315 (-),score=52.58 TRINITY_DN2308_c0_g1_i1:27-971(-)